MQNIVNIALLVPDYDEAIQFYTQVMQFDLVEDTPVSPTKRFVRVKPRGTESAPSLLLAKANKPQEIESIGKQAGGKVFLFLHIDNFDTYLAHLISHKVEIVRGPVVEPYGKVAVVLDIYGNKWDIIQPTP